MLLNFLIYSQSTAEMDGGVAETGSSIAVVGACAKVGISGRADIGASPGKDVFGPFRVSFLLYGASSVVYSRGVGK
jgi:hypothetical protein